MTILVPGYRGSFLVTEGPEPERAWLTVGQALSRGERTLALPFPGQRPVPAYGPLRPDGPMTQLSAVFVSVVVSARSDFFVDAEGKPVEVDAFEPAVWLKQGWGPFADPALREDEAYRGQLVRMLEAHRELHEALAPKPGLPAAPFETLVVVGTGRPTVSGMRMVDGKVDVEHPARADGDGAVLSSRAVPVLPMAWQRVDSAAEHVALMSDREVLHAVERFLRGETVGVAYQP